MIVTIGDIWRGMGGTGNYNKTQATKINDSLTKQGLARVFFDNALEAIHYKYPHYVADSNLISFSRISASYHGREITAIKLHEAPVQIQFAATRKQITEIPIELLQSGVSMTDLNLRVEDYLLYLIPRAKRKLKRLTDRKYTPENQKAIKDGKKLTISLKTFYERTGTNNKRKCYKGGAVEAAESYLEHYKKCEYITGYRLTKGSIIITLQ